MLLPAIAGLGLVLLFGLHAPRVPRPLLDLKLYRSRAFSAASITTFGLGAALFGAMILVPLYYQQVRGESVIVTGLLNGPQGLGALISMPLASRLTERFGAGRVAITGVSLLALMTLPLAFVGSDTSILLISLTLFVRGFSIGLSFMPAMTVAYQSLRRDQISDATPQMNVLQRVGGAIGTAILAVVLQRASVAAVATGNAIKHAASPEHAAALHATLSQQLASAFDTAYWWAFGIALLSLVPCVFLLRVERPPQAERAEEPPLEAAAMEAVGA